MRKIIALLLLSVVINHAYSQDNFSIHFAQTYSKFKFVDSEGNVDENLSSDIRYSYGVNYNKIFESGIFIRPELAYKNFGAISILNNKKLSWSLHYADINVGGGYIINKYKFKPYIGASLYFSYLYKADQTIGLDYYDMIDNGGIKKFDFGLNAYLGVSYSFSEVAGVFFELRNCTGFNQLEPNKEEQSQELYNRAFSFHFGLAFSIVKKQVEEIETRI